MSRRRLFLMRHAETGYFADPHAVHAPDTPLTPRGREQAVAAGEVLKPVSFDRVITSGTARSAETASLVTGREPDDFEVWHDIREIDSGRLDELPPEAIERTFSTFMRGISSNDDTLFGGERIGDLLDRVFPACERLRAETSWETALAVLHGVVNRAVLSWALLGSERRWFLGGLEQASGCINVIDMGSNDVLVRMVNYCPWDPLHFATRSSTMETLRSHYEQRQG